MKLFEKFTPKQSASDKPNAEKIHLSGEDFAAQNPYYAMVARGYQLAQMTFFGLLCAFIILSMLIRADDITYENFFYLFKDIHAAVDSEDISFQTLVYNADETQDFATYRGGLAVVGESGLTVFSATGRQTLIQPLNMSDPKLLTSDRFILVYELNGSKFVLYNSFVRMESGQTDAPIRCAAMSDDGWFALAAQDGPNAKVSVYNKHSNLVTEHYLNGYVTALSLNPAGDILAIASTDAVSGRYQTKLTLFRTGSDDKLHDCIFDDFFPLSCEFVDNKTIYLTSTDRMLVLEHDGEIIVDLTCDIPISRVFYSQHGYAILTENALLTIYRKDGSVIGQRADMKDVRSVLVGNENVYMMTEFALIHYTIEDAQGSVSEYHYPLQKLLWYSEDELLLCSRSTARFIRPKD